MRLALALALLVSASASAQALKTDDEKSLYAIGYLVGSRNLGPLNLKPHELEIVKHGITDGASGKKAQVEPEGQMEKVNAFAQSRSSAQAEKEKSAGKEYLEKAAKEPGVQKLPSGLIYKTLTAGNGPTPAAATDKVKVNYEGRLTNGTVFDSSYKRGQPAEFALNQVIKCWTEGVQKMKVGEKARLVCPSDIAYGDHGHPPSIPGGATLIFDVELLGINGK
ncbi:MAG TPA: FKBP-type peptidyl-prolyl cis-trans isomerase [Myxococcales bacterium]|jgi:FKBP-type peptidyl-prolyl cis-trans isomerase FkpA|nr:FKBP-type peptidyl-prolyl cis-trans isomerase [Myxococcales bacterium]